MPEQDTKRKGKIREQEQLQPCPVVRSIEPAGCTVPKPGAQDSCSLGNVLERKGERKREEGDLEELYEERAENAAQGGFLNLWHAGLARLVARLRSIRTHPGIVSRADHLAVRSGRASSAERHIRFIFSGITPRFNGTWARNFEWNSRDDFVFSWDGFLLMFRSHCEKIWESYEFFCENCHISFPYSIFNFRTVLN